MILDTLIFIVAYSLLVLGILSVVNAIDELFLGGIIGDTIIMLIDKFIDSCERFIKKIKGDK